MDLVLRLLAALGFCVTGVLHFTHTDAYVSVMPPWLPAHEPLVHLSGVAEVVGGLGLLPPSTRRAAGWWLIATLVAVFPANVHMAVQAERYDVPGGPWALYARLPLQLLLIAWVRRAMRVG
ncbi:MAG: hypothetical protein AVDCRST_MAG79-353 [uncultured Thermoleophilia bacterium]|uniref:Cytoplasmic membrane protein FsxA n=1 Tax=uncultured Thermoleophilia bacterium TaxID=1497501 RepID=A0A6J4TIS3_9ACTN|nr:MAG: hypothetical protein AVDCRST_MAG79-353 [uncultured Thermoleophilia bacterium]